MYAKATKTHHFKVELSKIVGRDPQTPLTRIFVWCMDEENVPVANDLLVVNLYSS